MALSSITRRELLGQSSAALFLPAALRAAASPGGLFAAVGSAPASVTAFPGAAPTALRRNGSHWEAGGIQLSLAPAAGQLALTLQSPKVPLSRLHLRWQLSPPANLRYLGDHWERSYGDLAWRYLEPERILPWYFLATDGRTTHACGVKTAPAAFCFWQTDPAGVSLWLDVRNGGNPVTLGARELSLATIVTASYRDTDAFTAASRFCRLLCDQPRLPAAPVYGGNNWYYAYSNSSAEDIRRDSNRIASCAPPSPTNKPFMVIDDGWEANRLAGPWTAGNAKFPDMARLAADMQQIGVQPGLWIRPLFTKDSVPSAWQLKSPNAALELSKNQTTTLDPTIPEVVELIKMEVRTIAAWGYSLVKHDFSTYDLLGRWGFSMGAQITDDGWTFADRSLTNAEIIRALYTALREAAGSMLLLGCNTVGHLGAGLFELQRIGDDTSGRDWNRTRKMGVNTLAFRAAQHNAFFAVDADCVGLTRQIPWTLNRQWLDLLARSGTPLFVSAAPDALGTDERKALRDAFTIAAATQPVGQPLDWLANTEPQKWSFHGHPVTYDWFGTEGSYPFAG